MMEVERRIRVKQHVVALLIIFAISMLSMLVTPVSVTAGKCTPEKCDGKDPIQMGCSGDAYTVVRAPITTLAGRQVGVVELRWSPSCQTNWARATSSSPTTIFVQLTDCNKKPIRGTEFSLSRTTSVYGDMKYNTKVSAMGSFSTNGVGDTFGYTDCK